MDADTKFNAPFRRQARIALKHTVLHFDSAAHSINDASKLDQGTIAGALHDTPVMHGYGWIDQIAPECPQPRQRTILIRACEPAVSDNVSRQNGRDFSCLAHADPLPVPNSTKPCRKGFFAQGMSAGDENAIAASPEARQPSRMSELGQKQPNWPDGIHVRFSPISDTGRGRQHV
jgi:hypothetical protein